MHLTAYRIGGNVVAARSEENAVAVLERHEPPGRWGAANAVPLTEAELASPVAPDAPETFAQALERASEPQLILWDYPGV